MLKKIAALFMNLAVLTLAHLQKKKKKNWWEGSVKYNHNHSPKQKVSRNCQRSNPVKYAYSKIMLTFLNPVMCKRAYGREGIIYISKIIKTPKTLLPAI